MLQISRLILCLVLVLAWEYQGIPCVGEVSARTYGRGAQESSTDFVDFELGPRAIHTNARTKNGTPVVPMWNAPMPKEGKYRRSSFPLVVQAQHSVVWRPTSLEQGTYNHYAALIRYEDQLFAMWANHVHGEDAPGQRVLYSKSDKWGHWDAPRELFPAPGPVKPRSKKGIHLKPDRWVVVSGTLYAIAYVHGAAVYPLARSVSLDGALGEPFLLGQLPESGELPSFMDSVQEAGQPSLTQEILQWYKEHCQVPWWADKEWGVTRKSIDGSPLIECFSYRAADGNRVLMMRNWELPPTRHTTIEST